MPPPTTAAPKFSFDNITEEQDRGPQTFLLYGPPKVGKTTFLCDVPRLFIICPEEGLKGIDKPPKHFPRAPRNLAEFYEAIEAFASRNTGPERPFYHLAIDTVSWLADMFAKAARAENRTRNLDNDFKSAWGTVSTLWDELFDKIVAVKRRCGIHVWLVAHGEQRQDSNAAGDTWPKWDLQLEKKAAALVRRSVDHVFFLNFSARLQKGGKGKRSVGQYTGRVIYTRDCADHFAGSRSSVPAEVPAEAKRLLEALSQGVPAPEARLRKELDELLPQLSDNDRAALAAQAREATTPRALAKVVAEAQSILASMGADDEEEPPPPPLQAAQAAAAPASTPRQSAPVEDEDEEGPPAPLHAAPVAAAPVAPPVAPAPVAKPAPTTAKPPAEERGVVDASREREEALPPADDAARARAVVDGAKDLPAVGKAFVALSKLPGLTSEQRASFAEELRAKKTALQGAAA